MPPRNRRNLSKPLSLSVMTVPGLDSGIVPVVHAVERPPRDSKNRTLSASVLRSRSCFAAWMTGLSAAATMAGLQRPSRTVALTEVRLVDHFECLELSGMALRAIEMAKRTIAALKQRLQHSLD